MVERRQARSIALEILYQSEITGLTLAVAVERRASTEQSTPEFTLKLLDGIQENKAMIDILIERYSENWILERLPIVDRNILRISMYEMVFESDIPLSVSINEAIELAKSFGGTESGRFVNGVLGQAAKNLEDKEKSTLKKNRSSRETRRHK
ncbi:MAG TPA: transcription antitermination factor NusB [Actinobacteria bacterium]|nr:transcription antitermination factor NusB [Actinomycetota bacterium]